MYVWLKITERALQNGDEVQFGGAAGVPEGTVLASSSPAIDIIYRYVEHQRQSSSTSTPHMGKRVSPGKAEERKDDDESLVLDGSRRTGAGHHGNREDSKNRPSERMSSGAGERRAAFNPDGVDEPLQGVEDHGQGSDLLAVKEVSCLSEASSRLSLQSIRNRAFFT